MPKQSIAELKKAIESAPEMTAEHRAEMLSLVDSLAAEIESGAEADPEKLRGAIAAAGEVIRQRSSGEAEEHHLAERLGELEEKVELVAVEHPVLANVLNALSRLV